MCPEGLGSTMLPDAKVEGLNPPLSGLGSRYKLSTPRACSQASTYDVSPKFRGGPLYFPV